MCVPCAKIATSSADKSAADWPGRLVARTSCIHYVFLDLVYVEHACVNSWLLRLTGMLLTAYYLGVPISSLERQMAVV